MNTTTPQLTKRNELILAAATILLLAYPASKESYYLDQQFGSWWYGL